MPSALEDLEEGEEARDRIGPDAIDGGDDSDRGDEHGSGDGDEPAVGAGALEEWEQC